MPIFKSEEEAWERHYMYNIDTDAEGKYNGNHMPSRNRLRFFLDNVPKGSYVLEVGCNSGGTAS